jgi:large subunit ribosomal protein L13
MRTWNAKPGEVDRKWWLVDADGLTVGRMASKIAQVLRGKHKPQFTPHVDTGDFVVVINTDRMKFTGAKWDNKKYYTHTLYIVSLK